MTALACCYRPYYEIRITPFRYGQAMVSTCYNNTFRPENWLLIKGGIQQCWNSKQFQFQRRLLSKRNWSFCRGTHCYLNPIGKESEFLEVDCVRDAIAEKITKLDYFAKVLELNISYLCNNRCSFCFRSIKNKPHSLSRNIIKELKQDIIPLVDHVILSGGEPFFDKQSLEFIDWMVSSYPQKRFSINTNGTLMHRFGLERLMNNDVYLVITFYGMRSATYRKATGSDNFHAVLNSSNKLIESGHKWMQLCFLVCAESLDDIEHFCNFVEKNQFVKAIIMNNRYDGKRYWKIMRLFENKYARIASRLKFQYQSETLSEMAIRKLYNPLHSLRYLAEKVIL
ncbi:MAG: radical SAM protein [Candidatus Omnitrophica bacterium]|nr:radical SAM protein [Candidatus Omnitrophota bacterium]